MLSRDSWILWLAIIGAIVTYLLASPPPNQWLYQDWLKAAMFIISTAAGKLATSPLPGADAANIGAQTAKVEEAKRGLVQAKKENDEPPAA